jgi:hypothetical protein
MEGMVVLIDGEIKAFTCGCPLSDEAFCVVYECTDLSIKGLAAFTFSAFCGRIGRYASVNIMDDSGLESLRKAKRSWHPYGTVAAFVAARQREKP